MKAMELFTAIGQAGIACSGADAAMATDGPEIVFDDHGSFRSVAEIVARDDKIVVVLEPHAGA